MKKLAHLGIGIGIVLMLAGALLVPWQSFELARPTLLAHVLVAGQLLVGFMGIVAVAQSDEGSPRQATLAIGALVGLAVGWVLLVDMTRALPFSLAELDLERMEAGHLLAVIGTTVMLTSAVLAIALRRKTRKAGLLTAFQCVLIIIATLAWQPLDDRPLAVASPSPVQVSLVSPAD